jgi:hypothetical protein
VEAQDGRSPADSITPVEDLSLATLIALVDRLRATETPNQFLCREIELDEAYLQADAEMRRVIDEQPGEEQCRRATLVRTHVVNAHDLLGESNIAAAVEHLNCVIEMKIGL